MTEIQTSPQALLKGTFAFYETPSGGRLVAYRLEGQEATSHFEIPAPLWRMVEAQQRGEKISPIQMVKSIMGS